jgi:hypothetical protein
MMDPSSQEWEMCPQKARRRGRRLGPGAHRCGPIGWTKLAIAVNDIGQAPKVEDLAQGEAPAMMKNSPGKQTPPSGAVPLALATRQVAPATVEPESHLMQPPYLVHQLSRGQNHGKNCCSSRCQSACLQWLGWTQEHKNHREDAMVYPGSSQSMPYV